MSQSLLAAHASVLDGRAGVALEDVVRVLGGRRVLAGVDLRAEPQERVGIVGRSGVGKSTLLSLVAGLDEADEGRVSVAGGTAPARRPARCALMPQRDGLLPGAAGPPKPGAPPLNSR